MVLQLATRTIGSVRSRFSALQGKRLLWLAPIMSKDHLEVTRDCARIPLIHTAKIDSIYDISPTVKELNVIVDSFHNQEFTFLPGQWVDMFISGVEKVGGFSITSTPKYFEHTKQIKLAVKFSTWPPAHWVHTECYNGSTVKLRSGGDFALRDIDSCANYIFVAGGVGINPIASMIQHLKDSDFEGRISLLYSAQTPEELIFKDSFDKLLAEAPVNAVNYFVTRKTEKCEQRPEWKGILFRRISVEDLRACITKTSHNLMFVCGPPSMIEMVLNAKIPDVTVYHENWWA